MKKYFYTIVIIMSLAFPGNGQHTLLLSDFDIYQLRTLEFIHRNRFNAKVPLNPIRSLRRFSAYSDETIALSLLQYAKWESLTSQNRNAEYAIGMLRYLSESISAYCLQELIDKEHNASVCDTCIYVYTEKAGLESLDFHYKRIMQKKYNFSNRYSLYMACKDVLYEATVPPREIPSEMQEKCLAMFSGILCVEPNERLREILDSVLSDNLPGWSKRVHGKHVEVLARKEFSSYKVETNDCDEELLRLLDENGD